MISYFLQTGAVRYEITKKVASNVAVAVVVTVTSSPIPGVQQIAVAPRVNSVNISFNINTQVG